MKRKIYIIIAFFLSLTCPVQAIDYVVISEVLYSIPPNDPCGIGTVSENFGQFIELYNVGDDPANLAGWQLTTQINGNNYTFPEGTVLNSRAYLIVAFGEDKFHDEFGWTYFHLIYNIVPLDALDDPDYIGLERETVSTQFQTQMPLSKNATDTLALLDKLGRMRDWIKYEPSSPNGMGMAAGNKTGCGTSLRSLQRTRVTFDSEGCSYYPDPENQSIMWYWQIDPSLQYCTPLSSKYELLTADPYEDTKSLINNYIVSVTPTTEISDIPEVNGKMQLDNVSAIVTVDHYDGLGFLLQTTEKGISPLGNDLVTFHEYDSFGREQKQWLPVPYSESVNTYVLPVPFKSAANSYEAYSEGDPYSEIIYSDSLLNYETGNKSPGTAWHDHPTEVAYSANSAGEVKLFYVNDNNSLHCGGTFAPHTLQKTQDTDEDGKKSVQYKNKQGQVVMTRQINNTSTNKNHDTYYVYNDLGQRCYMLSPLASDALNDDVDYPDSNDALQKYAYIYKYDSRNNCIYKKLPGCEPQLMVYDKTNRIVASQDGNLRVKNQWIIFKYDISGHLLYTGLINRDISEPEKTLINNSVVTESFASYSGFAGTGYTCSYFPNEIQPLTVNYYDNYYFLEILPANIVNNLVYQEKNGYDKAYAASPVFGNSTGCKGLLTGTVTRILGADNFLYEADYYDYRGRIVQTRATNHLGGYDITYNQYNFSGNATKSLIEQSTNITHTNPLTELYTYTYDHAQRLIDTYYQINSKPEILLSRNSYDELGRLIKKQRHNGDDTEQYEYNIRNWMTKIKSGDFEQNLYYNRNFPFGIASGWSPLYNGNIAVSTWTYNGTVNGYTYFYDGLNRLSGDYSIMNSQWKIDGQSSENFSYDKNGNITNLTRYDATDTRDVLKMIYNGNQVKKITDSNTYPATYDMKEYQDLANLDTEFYYDANGNMTTDLDRDIVTIKYNLLNLPELIQFKNGCQICNTYSADGKKLSTRNVTVMQGVYNPLNAGQVIDGLDVNEMDFVTVTGTDYVDNKEYGVSRYFDWDVTHKPQDIKNLSRINNPEGYAGSITTSATNGPVYYYYRKDHLGNNCEVWNAAYPWGTTSKPAGTYQRTQYYPSGLPWAFNSGDSPGVQPYKYGGKEFIEMHGLDEYDSQARMYYPAIMRTTTMDPLAENYPWISLYAWCGNNPVRNVDLDGRDWFTPENENKGENDRAFNDIMKIISGTDIPITLPSNTFVLTGDKDKDKEKDAPIINIDPKKKEATVGGVLVGGTVLEEIGDAVVSFFSEIGEGIISMAAVGAAELVSLIFLKGDTDPQEQYNKSASDTNKNEKHGDGGRAKTKAEKQVDDLEKQKAGASTAEKARINNKIRNIKDAAARKAKGEEHSRGNKR